MYNWQALGHFTRRTPQSTDAARLPTGGRGLELQHRIPTFPHGSARHLGSAEGCGTRRGSSRHPKWSFAH
eukprot:9718487-Alexandrium_andersonii.AAC.1